MSLELPAESGGFDLMPSCVRDGEDYLIPLALPPRPPACPLLFGLLIGVGLVAIGLCVAVGRAVLA